MRRFLFYLAAIGICAVLAVVFFKASYHQNRKADAIEAFAALDFKRAEAAYADISEKFGGLYFSGYYLGGLLGDADDKFNEVRYWQKDYIGLEGKLTKNENENALSKRTKFIAVNASYRKVGSEKDKSKVLEKLSLLASRYQEIMNADPDNFDAAFNFEFLTRVLEEVKKNKRKVPLNMSGNPDLHGLKGEPLDLKDGDKIKIFIPKDEQTDREDINANTGGAGRKKG